MAQKVEVQNVMFRKDDLINLSEYIYEVLQSCMDSQIYIENSLYEAMIKKAIIASWNYATNFHYDGSRLDGVEKTYKFIAKGKDGIIFFAANCKGYKQITYFHKDDICYTHYMQGVSEIVLIHEDIV